MLKFLLVDVLFRLVRIVVAFFASMALAAMGFIFRAHKVFLTNLFSSREAAHGALVKRQVRRT